MLKAYKFRLYPTRS
ncbi:helix-turn-helix domain-containing protein, partial [Methanothrix soehngenii]